jgi:glycerol-3-phosphate dehydrogenase
MKRDVLLNRICQQDYTCEILIIGGGATGLGTAVDAASRGYKVILLEQDDFAKGTSSRSTKLVHGGVRYLAQGDVRMVCGALQERGRMRKNAPHLVKDMRFIIGNYRWWEQPFYAIGLTIYDILAGRLGLGHSSALLKRTVRKEIPGLKQEGLRGGVVYHDGQFDDARMAISLAQTGVDHGAICLNYVKVDNLLKDNSGKLSGVNAVDQLTGERYTFKSKVVINATGVFVDDIMKLDTPEARKKVRPSQGVHLVVDSKFLGGKSALMIPKTKDGRVLFGVPWHGKVVLGTTDTPLNHAELEPLVLEEEVDFILDQAGQYLDLKPTRADVLSVFAGLRPLAALTCNDTKKTKEISRNHKIYKSKSGLLTITGGKWTTYREMAEEVVDQSLEIGGLINKSCVTKDLKIHGYAENVDMSKWDYVYGSDVSKIDMLKKGNSEYAELLHENFTFTVAHVIWAVREEMAQSIEDVLARRVRLLFLDARAAIKIAPRVASIIAKEMNKDKDWENNQIQEFTELAKGYTVNVI